MLSKSCTFVNVIPLLLFPSFHELPESASMVTETYSEMQTEESEAH